MYMTSDEQIVIIARERDPEAFGELVKRHQTSLFRFVRSIVWEDESARDVTQSAFERAFVALHAFDARRSFRAWLFTIAKREAFSHLRQVRRHPVAPLETTEGETIDVPDQHTGPDEHLLQRESRERVRTGLQRLKPAYRSVLELYYVEELSYGEIAQHLHLPLNTVRTHLRRAKQALAQALGKNLP